MHNMHNIVVLQDPGLFAPGKAPTKMSWARLEAVLKALRDLQTDQQLDKGQERSIRDFPFIKRLMDNYQRGMAQLKKESVCCCSCCNTVYVGCIQVM